MIEREAIYDISNYQTMSTYPERAAVELSSQSTIQLSGFGTRSIPTSALFLRGRPFLANGLSSSTEVTRCDGPDAVGQCDVVPIYHSVAILIGRHLSLAIEE
jgi:hypothetical protein